MSRLKSIARWSARIALVGIVLFIGGFFWFVHNIGHSNQNLPARADGIVALTGGAFRISEADRLLDAGLGKRLLITGVNEITTRKELKKLMPKSQEMFDCCVDIDREALNTIGNADETSKWVKNHGFQSIIVVTSSYHMLRSLTELRRAMPDVTFIPHSVRPKNLHIEDWWYYPQTARILASEYVKLVAAVGRFGACRIASHVYDDSVMKASSY